MLPELNTVLRVGVGRSPDPEAGMRALDVASRVEDVEPPVTGKGKGGHLGRVLIATPSYAGDYEAPVPGTACSLTWTTTGGILQLPTAFMSVVAPGEGSVLRTWRMEVTGAAKRVQRREHFRCACRLPLTLTVLPLYPRADADEKADDPHAKADENADGSPESPDGDAAEPRLVVGVTADLSEGGLRCVVPADGLAQRSVRVDLELEPGHVLTLEGTVLRASATGSLSSPGAFGTVRPMETVVAFRDPEVHGDALRKAIFAEQMRQRRMGLV